MNKTTLPWLAVLFIFIIILISAALSTSRTKPINVSAKQKLGDARLYPNPTFTPGDVFPNVTSKDVCIKGYTKTVRNVSISLKKLIFQEYGVSYPQPQGSNEVDHFIPLELGGSNDIKNLWIEPANPNPGFHEKDVVENYLHDQVCSGKVSLQDAQKAIQADWYAVYQSMSKSSFFE